jgi:hypothetical protein
MKYIIATITAALTTSVVVAASLGSPESSAPQDYGSSAAVQLGHGPAGLPSASGLDYGSPALLQEGHGPAGAPRP